MRRIIATEAITLDGRFADADGAIDWQPLGEEHDEYSIALLDEVDTLLLGRVTYDQLRAFWAGEEGPRYDTEIARRMNAHRKLVVGAGPVDAGWANTERLTGDLGDAVAEVKQRRGADIAILGSGRLVAGLTELGLIDEYRLVLNPVALGAGPTLFDGLPRRAALRLVDVAPFASGAVVLRYVR
jgi:dihydrofolate reductase